MHIKLLEKSYSHLTLFDNISLMFSSLSWTLFFQYVTFSSIALIFSCPSVSFSWRCLRISSIDSKRNLQNRIIILLYNHLSLPNHEQLTFFPQVYIHLFHWVAQIVLYQWVVTLWYLSWELWFDLLTPSLSDSVPASFLAVQIVPKLHEECNTIIYHH